MCINNLKSCVNFPKQYYAIKKIKKIYYENNIYYDVYRDNINNICINDIHTKNTKYKKYNSLTAEHIFPQSYTKNHKKAKYDMHNIFLTQSLLNSDRSNYKFSDINNNYIEDVYLLYLLDYDYFLQYNRIVEYDTFLKNNNIYNYKINKKKIFIPNSNSKGLIARSIAYMDYTYKNVDINNVIEMELLIKWNYEHPPTAIEKKQNKIIQNYQGNMNIFIDNYKLIDYIYNK